MKRFIITSAVVLSLVFASVAYANSLSDRVENWLQNHYYPYNGEPFDVKNAHCHSIDGSLFSCDITLHDQWANPNLPPVYIKLYDKFILVASENPLDLVFCSETVGCR